MAQVTPAADYPNAAPIAEALRLEMTYASIARMKHGDVLIRGAMLAEGGAVNVVAGVSRRRQLFLSFDDSRLPYRAIEGQVFGAGQRIQPSRFSEGFAVVFVLDGLAFAIIADSPDDVISAIFCIPPNPERGKRVKITKRDGAIVAIAREPKSLGRA
jgi:hypothetical protein